MLGDGSMSNEEVLDKIHEGFILCGWLERLLVNLISLAVVNHNFNL
jgi:hypothetical protein